MFKRLSLTLLLMPGLALATSQPAQASEVDDSDLEYKAIVSQQSDEAYPVTYAIDADSKSDKDEHEFESENDDVDEISILEYVQDLLNDVIARANFAELDVIDRRGDLFRPRRLAENTRQQLQIKAALLAQNINHLLPRWLEEPGPDQHELFRKILLLFARSHMLQQLYPDFLKKLSSQQWMTPRKLQALAEVFAGWHPTTMFWQRFKCEGIFDLNGIKFSTGGTPLFNFYFDHNNLQHSQLFLLLGGKSCVDPISPGITRIQHHTLDCENRAAINNQRIFRQHPIVRLKKFARMLQLTRQNVEQRLIPALAPMVMQYAALVLPAQTINGILAMTAPQESDALEDIEHLGTMEKQLALEEKILQLPPKCQQRIAQLYCGNRQCAQALIEKNAQANRSV